MIKTIAASAAIFCATSALAAPRCVTGPWVSRDKTLHAAGNAALVLGTDVLAKEFAPRVFNDYPYIGVLPAVAASAMREFDKVSFGGNCEYASMTYDVLGIAVGMFGTRVLLTPQPGGVRVTYHKEF